MKPMARKPRFWTLNRIRQVGVVVLMFCTISLTVIALDAGITDLGTGIVCILAVALVSVAALDLSK